MGINLKQKQYTTGFTIVELLIVVVVIAILAAITIVAYNGINNRAKDSALKSSLQQAYKKLESHKTLNGSYPASLTDIGIVNNGGTTYGMTIAGFDSNTQGCVWARTGDVTYSIQDGSQFVEGECGQVIASYHKGRSFNDLVLKRSELDINHLWSTGSPSPLVPNDNFSSKFETRVIPPVTGTYTFYTSTDDSVELLVNGVVVVALTGSGVREATSSTVELIANQPVSVVYNAQEGAGSAYARLSWSYPDQARQIIPANRYLRP